MGVVEVLGIFTIVWLKYGCGFADFSCVWFGQFFHGLLIGGDLQIFNGFVVVGSLA